LQTLGCQHIMWSCQEKTFEQGVVTPVVTTSVRSIHPLGICAEQSRYFD
jgi:hypothetical protein